MGKSVDIKGSEFDGSGFINAILLVVLISLLIFGSTNIQPGLFISSTTA